MTNAYEKAARNQITEMDGRTSNGRVIVVGHGLVAITYGLLAVTSELRDISNTLIAMRREAQR